MEVPETPDFQPIRERPLLKTLAALLVLAGALPLGAVSLPSPLRYGPHSGISVLRADPAGERLLDLDVRGLARLRSLSEKESVTLEDFPFAPGATGNLVLERFNVVSADGVLVVQGPDGETSSPLPRGTHFQGHLEGEPDSRVYVGVPGDFLVAVLQTSAGLVYVGPDGPTAGPVQHVVRRSDSLRNAELAPRPGKDAARDVGGILEETAEIPDGAQLDREPEATRVASPRRDPAAVVVGAEEAARELVGRQLAREPAVVLLGHPATAGREAQDPGVGCHGSISRLSIAAWRSAAEGRL